MFRAELGQQDVVVRVISHSGANLEQVRQDKTVFKVLPGFCTAVR
jgi:hypothetical protein